MQLLESLTLQAPPRTSGNGQIVAEVVPQPSPEERPAFLLEAALLGPVAIMSSTGRELPEWMKASLLVLGVVTTGRATMQLLQSHQTRQSV